MKPLLSLVTGKVERDSSFARLVQSIAQHTTVDWELVIADASESPFRSDWVNVRVLHEKPRQGHCRGYNSAFREAQGEWLLFLNDDAEVCANYDTEAISFMQHHPRIGLGALHYSENGGPFHANSAWGCTYANFGIFRKSLGEQVGFFDEELTMYGGDNSLAIRILLAGKGIADIPKAHILHHSTEDPIRENNQQYRRKDNRVLSAKYMPSHSQWVSTFRKYEVFSSNPPWSHGVAPKMVRA